MSAAPIYLDATLVPNRALSPLAFKLIMVIVIVVSVISGLSFVSKGAYPVLGFFGLDILAIWLAFRLHFRAQEQSTRVCVTASDITLEHTQPGKPPRLARLPTAFVRIDLHHPPRAPSQLRLSHGASAWSIGQFLTPAERKSLCLALQKAVQDARAARY